MSSPSPPELDPFTQTYNKLYDLARSSAALQPLVKVGNFITYGGESRGPVKDTVTAADLPELMLSTMGSSAINVHSSSCGTSVTRVYTWLLSTGDARIDKFLYPVQFALFCSLVDYKTSLMGLTWRGKNFIRKSEVTSLVEGVSNPMANRGIRGWSSIWSCSVDMVFAQQDLVNFNNG